MKKFERLESKILSLQVVDRPIVENILWKKTCKDIWDSLNKNCQETVKLSKPNIKPYIRIFKCYKWRMMNQLLCMNHGDMEQNMV